MFGNLFGRSFRTAALVAVLFGIGCQSEAERHRVDPEQARATLDQVLNSWKAGETPQSWQAKSPQVYVQDLEWQNGTKLVSFQILPDVQAIDANLHCPVKLVVLKQDGSKSEKTVKYLVGTSPVRTVFRALEP